MKNIDSYILCTHKAYVTKITYDRNIHIYGYMDEDDIGFAPRNFVQYQ